MMTDKDIYNRLRSIEMSLTEFRAEMTAHVQNQVEQCDQHDRAIFGTDTSRGILTRLDRVEVVQKARGKWVWAVVMAVLASVGAWIANLR